MHDTDSTVQQLYHQKIMERSRIERLRKGDDMFAFARAIVLAGISGASKEKYRLFFRFYGRDFSADPKKQIKKILCVR